MKVVAGIDLGGTNTKFSWVNDEGEVLEELRLKTADYPDPKEWVSAVCRALIEAKKEDWVIQGVGIGAPNGNLCRGTIEFAPNLKWKGTVPLKKFFEEFFEVPILVSNDANASAIGEMIYGGAQGMRDFIQITLGTGVGSGIVCNGQLVLGHDAFAGELGHVIIKENGRKCGCGRRGCLETYCSATGVVRTARRMMKKNPGFSSLEHKDEFTAYDVCLAAEDGDVLAQDVFEFTGKKLGFALANAVAVTEPQAIFLFGGLTDCGPRLFDPVKKHFERYLMEIYRNKIDILPSALKGSDAAILGAAALVWNSLKS